ncbi:VOC family protein [Arthrobacter sp. M4]|uniref:VOC family protein n=1 Tax=Arthrobacter sp. M4 TaxID=218160 RepID=UPI001CDD3EDB|nr:VOC family protein [Arthrobacter sp. M4]MCA4131423.1 VOC family protein [Arthrobacter sp. M4]
MQKISTCLWFDDQAEDAANFYTSIFKNSGIQDISRYGDTGPGEPGRVMTVQFQLEGREFTALNGGPAFTFNESVSMVVDCSSQDEVDAYWDALTADGGQESQCGWLKDKFGLSWQIIPNALPELLNGPDPEGARRAMEAMLQMRKIDIATLQKAYDGDWPA